MSGASSAPLEPPGPLAIDTRVLEVARDAAAEGGRAILVGGFVRDRRLGIESKDVDVEFHGLALERVEVLLSRHGRVDAVGKAFGVFRVAGLDVDFSLPRRDSKVGPGHRGFDVDVDPELGFEEAARRRDLTINSMGLDPLTGELLDPFGGQADLEAGRLRATDARHFGEDPLRGLRVCQFAARLGMAADDELIGLCRDLDLSELPGERLFSEFEKLLLRSERPSIGLNVLRATALVRFFPELEALIDVPQEERWHPEGDVWIHTGMVIDEAAKLRVGGGDDAALMFGALCHDFGKPSTTQVLEGRIRSLGHEGAGEAPAVAFLERMRAPPDLIKKVVALVREHLAPRGMMVGGAKQPAWRRLARRVGVAGVSLALLERVARADALGRTTPDAIAGRADDLDEFLRCARDLEVDRDPPADVVLGRHLLARGMKPGPKLGQILARCRDVQDDTGWDDVDRILDRALGEE